MRLSWIAFALGTLNAALFLAVIVGVELVDLVVSAPHLIAILWVGCLATAAWALRAVDLARPKPLDGVRLVIRGGVAGIALGAIVAFVTVPGSMLALAFGAPIGGAAGLACATIDVAALRLWRALQSVS